MTDLEITRLCAEAMGIAVEINTDSHGTEFAEIIQARNSGNGGEYSPLTDDAQAMALVKRFRLALGWDYEGKIWCEEPRAPFTTIRDAADLNRAICLCVAKMQQAKAER